MVVTKRVKQWQNVTAVFPEPYIETALVVPRTIILVWFSYPKNFQWYTENNCKVKEGVPAIGCS